MATTDRPWWRWTKVRVPRVGKPSLVLLHLRGRSGSGGCDLGRLAVHLGLVAVLGLVGGTPCAGQSQPVTEGTWPAWYDGGSDLPSGVHAIERDSTYAVVGSTAGDLQDAMDATAPMVDGRRVQGAHTWQWWHHYEYKSEGHGECRVTKSVVLVRSVIVLPEWENRATIDRDLVRAWNGYRFRLREHEDGHRTITLASATQLWNAVRSREPSPCASIKTNLRALADSVFVASEELQRQYDDQTSHGLRQGARWPPG